MLDNTKMIELEESCYSQRALMKDAAKHLSAVESQGLRIRSLKESITKEVLQLKLQFRHKFSIKDIR